MVPEKPGKRVPFPGLVEPGTRVLLPRERLVETASWAMSQLSSVAATREAATPLVWCPFPPTVEGSPPILICAVLESPVVGECARPSAVAPAGVGVPAAPAAAVPAVGAVSAARGKLLRPVVRGLAATSVALG